MCLPPKYETHEMKSAVHQFAHDSRNRISSLNLIVHLLERQMDCSSAQHLDKLRIVIDELNELINDLDAQAKPKD